jgi:hypothetical protein
MNNIFLEAMSRLEDNNTVNKWQIALTRLQRLGRNLRTHPERLERDKVLDPLLYSLVIRAPDNQRGCVDFVNRLAEYMRTLEWCGCGARGPITNAKVWRNGELT